MTAFIYRESSSGEVGLQKRNQADHASESMRSARQDQLLAAKNRDCCLGTL